jgi:hypothetical protein
MRKQTTLAVVIVALIISSLLFSGAYAQLIIADKDVKVVKVDVDKERIEITRVDSTSFNTDGYLYITYKTKTYKNGNPFDWTKIKRGWIIRAKGGVRFDMNVNAEKIWVIKT